MTSTGVFELKWAALVSVAASAEGSERALDAVAAGVGGAHPVVLAEYGIERVDEAFGIGFGVRG